MSGQNAHINKDTGNLPKKVGHPLKFSSPAQLKTLAQKYFNRCTKLKIPITICDLALALGTYRDVLIDYEVKYGDEFANVIKWAKTVTQAYAERRVFGPNPTGAIFVLKNYGWKDNAIILDLGLAAMPPERQKELSGLLKSMYTGKRYTASLRPSIVNKG